ncbi:hypothetical protein [Amycolatopsis sp. NPDC051071]|uniref:hypothetical protein n=1 Tax=Amycolatopsis sp. NPDC051071 TaxID=3154637 RepID=UPI003438C8FD
MTSFANRFTRHGRLRNRWAAALAEPDPAHRLRSLLALQTEFTEHPKALAASWPPYVADVLAIGGGTLPSDDLSDLEARGAIVADGSGGRLGLADAWSPLIAARDARGEYAVACARMAALYWWAGLPAPAKSALARELARRGADGPYFREVYVDHLTGGAASADEGAITAILAAALVVGFDADPDRVAAAGELAAVLRAAEVTLPGIDLALGYSALLVEDAPAGAARYLEAAWQQDRGGHHALVGLASAWLRSGAHDRIAALAAGHDVPRVVGELAELSAVLRWFDDADVDGLCPAASARLARLRVGVEAAEWLDYAVGRALLLEGDAEGAAQTLVPLADRHRDRPGWNYHAAWALLLLGDREGIATRFAAAAGHSDRWTIGCLLIEADPGAADTIAAEAAADGLPESAAAVVAARAALAGTGTAPRTPDGVDGGPTAHLEHVRGGIGASIAAQNGSDTTRWVADPWFTRLPLADQLVWTGLAWPEPGLLEYAADGLGYARAALVLSVLTRDPARLERLSRRTDPAVELMRAWADQDNAGVRLSALLEVGEPRARYAHGQFLLTTGDFAGAAEEFRAAAELGDVTPRDARLLQWAAAAAGPDGDGTPVPEQPPWKAEPTWVSWTAALVTLAREPATAGIDAAAHCVRALVRADDPPAAAVRAVAVGLARARLETDDPIRVTALGDLADELATATGCPDALRMREVAAAGRARRYGATHELVGAGAPTALAIAERVLGNGDDAGAARALRAVPADESAESRFCHLAAAALTGAPAPLPDPPPAPDVPTGLATLLLMAAVQVDEAPARALQSLVPVLREHDLTGLVDLNAALPHLHAAVRTRRAPEYLTRLVHRATRDAVGDPLTAARHLTAIGEHETADPFWRRAIGDAGLGGRACLEYAAILRHRAVIARRAGDELRAAGHLLLAARVADATTAPALMPTSAELDKLRRDFRKVKLAVSKGRRKRLDGTWTTNERALAAATARGDEERALLCLARLHECVEDGLESGLSARARRLVLARCVDRLLGHLFPGDDDREYAGRYRVLERAVESYDALFYALLDKDRAAGLTAWRRFVPHLGSALLIQHALAVLYRERALAAPGQAGTLVVATALWAGLLSSERFWARCRDEVRDDERRLRAEVMRELLAAHAVRGRRALADGDEDAARRHLGFLAGCDDVTAVQGTLAEFGLPFPGGVDPQRFAEVAAIARETFDGWVGDVIAAAREVVADPAAIARLPEGISADYEGGIAAMKPFLRLDVPVRTVLQTVLGWYNEWAMAVYHREEMAELADLTEAAAPVARALEPLCDKGKAMDPANQTLSRHLMLRGFGLRDPAKARSRYREALAWDPGNSNAETLLADAADELAARQLQKAAKAIEAGRDDEALSTLDGIEPGSAATEQVRRQLRAAAYFRRATRLMEQGKLDAARKDLNLVLREDPEPGIRALAETSLVTVNLRAAMRAKDWTLARSLADERMAQARGAERKALPEQLAAAFNAEAIHLANESREAQQPFENAFADVMKRARLAIEGSQYGLSADLFAELDGRFPGILDRSTRFQPGGQDCAVCGGAAKPARVALIASVVARVTVQGEFQATVKMFWDEHRGRLCRSCAARWIEHTQLLTTACELLEDGLALDPKNKTIRRNLEELRRAQ